MPYDVAFSIDISAIYIAISGLFLVLLAIDVIRGRWKYQEGFSEGDQDPLSRRIQVRANAAEFFPVALLLLVAVENIVAVDWVIHSLGCLLLVSRLFHAAGLRGMAGESLPRILGTAGSITMISVSAVLVLVNSF
ncbi:MAG: hypothetical protein COA46_03765 [Porticoccaceae bacterium]|nr:MAG: hypothetical protein COA46_03765 [Porticoccaceae bacterium]